MAEEVLENFFIFRGFSVASLLSDENFLLPVIRVESDYLAPLHPGDQVEVVIEAIELGNSSVTIIFSFRKKGAEVGRVRLVHVCVDRKSGGKRELPSLWRECFTGVGG